VSSRRPALLALLLAAACSKGAQQDPEQPAPIVPAPVLAPLLPDLEALAKLAEPPADLREVRELFDLAFVPGAADERLAARSRKSLLEHPQARWALEEGMLHADPAVRAVATFELGQLGLQASILPLLKRVKYELDPACKVWVAGALARLGNGAGFPLLTAAMRNEATANDAGAAAVTVLKAAEEDPGESPTWAQLQQGIEKLQGAWRTTSRLHGAPPVTEEPALLEARIAQHLVALHRFQLRPVEDARFILRRAGSLSLPLLRRCLGASEPFLRSHALEVLGELGRSAASLEDAVLPLLGDELTRADAARALGAMGAVRAFEPLAAMLAGRDLELRVAVAAALGQLGDARATPLLATVVAADGEPMDLRVQAAYGHALLERGGAGMAFLEARKAAGDYHPPTVLELLDKVAAASR
jgi:HEAT repeat protein